MTRQHPHRSLLRAAGLAALLLLLSACAGADPLSRHGAGQAGFWIGLWHGFILPVSIIVSWFDQSVGIYDVHNSGGWYDTGFVLGASFVFGTVLGGSRGASSASRRRNRGTEE
ncbi:MAG: hypothetical protein WB797_14500 [Nocardioides sp.]